MSWEPLEDALHRIAQDERRILDERPLDGDLMLKERGLRVLVWLLGRGHRGSGSLETAEARLARAVKRRERRRARRRVRPEEC